MQWEQIQLGEVAEFRNGINYTQKNLGTGIKIIGVSNFRDNFHVPFDELEELNPVGIVRDSDIIEEGDLVFVRSNGNPALVGRCMFVANCHEKITHSGFTIRLRFKDNRVLPYFYAQYFRSGGIKRSFAKDRRGTNITNLSQGMLAGLFVPLPPLIEQRKIVAILGTWDRAIAAAERIVVTLRVRKQALMQRLLTGEVRFPEYVHSYKTQPTELGILPADWKYVQIGTIAQHVSIKNSAAQDLPVLSCTKYDGLVDSLQYFGRQIFSDDTSTYKIVKRHQFAYATNHIEEGSIGYQQLHDAALISPMYTVFETDNCVDDNFLYALLKTETYRRVFERSMSATVDRRGSLRWPEFSKLKIPLPSLAEQQRIAEFLRICDMEIAQHARRLELLRQQKRGLMQRLLTGEVRVAVDS